MTYIIENGVQISPLADLEVSTRGSRIKIGENSKIDAFVKIKAAGGLGNITIGSNCVINSSSTLYIGNGISIGNDSMIGSNVVFAPTNHEFKDLSTLIRNQGFSPSKGGIIIGDDVWIGSGCVILDGTEIGSGSVIGAMSLVRGKIPPLSIAGGNPLNIIGRRE
jgi:acetyltransferase-like isoleucine patch superfamily enzyme